MVDVQQWDVCRDCLVPLESALRDLHSRWHRPLVEPAVAQDERGTVSSDSIGGKLDPPRAFDIWRLNREYDVDLGVEWLHVNVSCEYGDVLRQRLNEIHQRLANLEFRCCQIINGDQVASETRRVRFAVQLLIARHEGFLRSMFSEHEQRPDVSEMPESMRIVEIEIVDAYSEIGRQLFEVCEWLARLAFSVKSRLSEANVPQNFRNVQQDESERTGLAVAAPICAQAEDDGTPQNCQRKHMTGRPRVTEAAEDDMLREYEQGLSDGAWSNQAEYAKKDSGKSKSTVSAWLRRARNRRESGKRPEN